MKALYSPSFREAGHCAAAADRRKVPDIKYVGNPMDKRGGGGLVKKWFKIPIIRHKKNCQHVVRFFFIWNKSFMNGSLTAVVSGVGDFLF